MAFVLFLIRSSQIFSLLLQYLLSEYSAYMTGEVVTIDGGEWLKGAGEFNGLDVVTKEEWAEIERTIRGK